MKKTIIKIIARKIITLPIMLPILAFMRPLLLLLGVPEVEILAIVIGVVYNFGIKSFSIFVVIVRVTEIIIA